MAETDTIAALASGAPPSGVAVLRLSGPGAVNALESLCNSVPPARRLALRTLRHPETGEVLDQGLVVVFPGPDSFTGEDCAELHLHGSPAVVRSVLRTLTQFPKVRLAKAGEFTRRAFEHGRLDLVEVDGLGDLIAAETESQRVLALSRMSGGITEHLMRWRDEIIFVMAEIEAQLDFSDEGDVSELSTAAIRQRLEELITSLDGALQNYQSGRIIREGFRIGIGGLPNAGKSSLLNRLAKSDIAIVTDEAGTTRDLREVMINLDGDLVILIDSAGIRDTQSKAEAEGVRRALEMLETADLVLWLVAPDIKSDQACPVSGPKVIQVNTKSDLVAGSGGLSVSAETGEGVDELLAVIRSEIEQHLAGRGDVTLSHLRDQEAITACRNFIQAALAQLDVLELAAESLRQASMALERLVGKVDAEQVLDRLFAGFCIGK